VPNTDEGPPPQGVSEVEGAAEDLVGGGVQGDREREVAEEGARALRRPECSQALLDFLTTTDVVLEYRDR